MNLVRLNKRCACKQWMATAESKNWITDILYELDGRTCLGKIGWMGTPTTQLSPTHYSAFPTEQEPTSLCNYVHILWVRSHPLWVGLEHDAGQTLMAVVFSLWPKNRKN